MASVKDVVELVDEFVTVSDRRRWAKLSSTINSRALELLLLREILVELRKLNGQRQQAIAREASE